MVGNIVDVGWATIKSGCLPITDYELVSGFDVFGVKDRRGMCHFTSLGMDSAYTVQPPEGRILWTIYIYF